MYYLAEARFKGKNVNGSVEDRYRYQIGWATSPEAIINQLESHIGSDEEPVGKVVYSSNGPFNSLLEAEQESSKHRRSEQ